VRQTVAAACPAGLKCHALLQHRVPQGDDDYEDSGNVPLDKMFGVSFEYRPAGLDMHAEAVCEHLTAVGHGQYFIPGGEGGQIWPGP